MRTALVKTQQASRKPLTRTVTYVLLFLFAAGVGALEYFHEVSHDDAAVCLAPQSRTEVMGELLFHHLKNH
jgi:hypothetical protein